MDINKLIREIRTKKMSSEQMKKFAQCCSKLASDVAKERCTLDCLLEEAKKYYPHINIEGLLARKQLDDEILAYIITAVLSMLREHDVKKSLGDLFRECASDKPLLEEMDAELTAMAASRVKKTDK